MATMVQPVRVARRKLIDRTSSAAVCTGGVRGYEAGSAPSGQGIHGVVVTGLGGRVAGGTLTHVHLWQPFTVHFLKALPLGDHDDPANEQVDPELTDARDTVHSVLLRPIGYGSGVEIDPAGHATGTPTTWEAGYLDWDGTKFRTATLNVGFIVFNAMECTR